MSVATRPEGAGAVTPPQVIAGVLLAAAVLWLLARGATHPLVVRGSAEARVHVELELLRNVIPEYAAAAARAPARRRG